MTGREPVAGLAASLDGALERGEMRVHYLPTVDLADAMVIGVEALARWQREGRVLDTQEYLEVAERTGLIVPIGRWVMSRACREVAEWNVAHPELRPLRLAVNLSLCQITEPDSVDRIEQVLKETAFDPTLLSLEVNEDVLHEMGHAAGPTLLALKGLGVRISVDDFGTGASSLVALQRYHLDEIKIDRSFVGQMDTDEDAAAIVRGVARLAQSMGLETVAEGVERASQEQMLRALRCDGAQGWLYARPMESLAEAVALATNAVQGSLQRKPVEHRELWEGMPTSLTAARFVEAVFESAPIGMALVDEAGRHLAVNPAVSEILGFSSSELIGMTCWELVHPEDLQADLAGMDALLNGERSTYVVEERAFGPDGNARWVEVTVCGVPGEHQANGSPARLLRQIRNIDASREAQRSVAVLESVVAATPDALIILDPVGRCSHWNAAAERLLGWTNGEMVGVPLTRLVGPDAQLRMARTLGDAAAGETVRWKDAVWISASGQRCEVDVTVGPIVDAVGGRMGLVAVARDVAEERSAAVALAEAHEALGLHAAELAAANVRLETFAGTLAHDLVQPLASAAGFLGLLELEASELTDGHREWVAGALRGTTRLTEAIEALHRNAVEQNLHLVPVDLDRVVDYLFADLTLVLGDADISVEPLPAVLGDRGFITQVIMNLVQNAGRYRHLERPLLVTIDARADGASWIVTVADTGKGISTDELETVFDAGSRGRSAIGTDGTGTGLATVRTLMHRMGGEAWAEPVPAGGVRMCLRFHAAGTARSDQAIGDGCGSDEGGRS